MEIPRWVPPAIAATAGALIASSFFGNHVSGPLLGADEIDGGVLTPISSGESTYMRTIDPTSDIGQKILKQTVEVDSGTHEDNSVTDPSDPIITGQPTRYKVRERSEIDASGPDNDMFCDTFVVPKEAATVQVAALGAQNESVSVSWPTKANGEPMQQIAVCVHPGDKMEPKSVVAFYKSGNVS